MRAAIVLVLFAAFAFAWLEPVVETEYVFQTTVRLINEINDNPNSTWTAGFNKFSGMTWAEVKKMLLKRPVPTSVRLSEREMRLAKEMELPESNAPESFDARKAFPNCTQPVRDQGQCGSCWAVSLAETLTDTFCVASNGTVKKVLSPQDLVSCDWTNQGCNGGILPLAWMYAKHSGIVSDACLPYVSKSGTVPSCPSECNYGGKFKDDKYYAQEFHHLGKFYFFERPAKIQEHIMKYGAVQTGFSVYQDFMSYQKGVYKHTTGGFLGGHAVKIIGWGVDSSQSPAVPYWIVQNSWGTNWGIDGIFWMYRGNNECGFEADAYGGVPNLRDVPK